MKWIALIVAALLASHSVAAAQGNPSRRGSVTGDPAASTANPRAETGGTIGASNGGKDDNGDQGRDKMPESNMSVRSQDHQSAKPK